LNNSEAELLIEAYFSMHSVENKKMRLSVAAFREITVIWICLFRATFLFKV